MIRWKRIAAGMLAATMATAPTVGVFAETKPLQAVTEETTETTADDSKKPTQKEKEQINDTDFIIPKKDQGKLKTYSTTSKAYKTMNKSGKFYFQIKDGKTSKVWINVKHAKDISWDYFSGNSSTWTCSLSGTNNHNIKLKVSSVKTKQSSDSCYTVFVFTLSYTQSAHYKKSDTTYDKPDGLRLNYRKYTKNGGDGDLTSDAPIVHSGTTRNITIQANSRCMGINNTDSKGGNKNIYTNCGTTINFTKPNRTVTFANGYGGNVATKTVADGGTVAAPGNPSRYGYNFTGWSGTVGSIVCASRTHTAQWSPWRHTVTYNANGGSNPPGNMTKTYGSSLAVTTDRPTRKGYNFVKWTTAANGTGTSYTPGQNYAYDQNGGTITLYAQWTPWTGTVKYDANGGSNTPANQTITYDRALTLSSQKPVKADYLFDGWTLDPNGTGTKYAAGGVFDVTNVNKNLTSNNATMTLYAKWIPSYTVKYDDNSDYYKSCKIKGSVSSQKQPVTQSVSLQDNGYTNENGTFKGWSLAKNAYQLKLHQYVHDEKETMTNEELEKEWRALHTTDMTEDLIIGK